MRRLKAFKKHQVIMEFANNKSSRRAVVERHRQVALYGRAHTDKLDKRQLTLNVCNLNRLLFVNAHLRLLSYILTLHY